MPELKTPDGKAVPVAPVDEDAVNRAFDAAMNDDGPDEAAPPKRQPGDGAPKRDAKPRTSRTAKSRTTSRPAAGVKDDYTDDAQALITTAWTVAASIPAAQAYAFALSQSADALIPALADGARHSAFVRSLVSGGGGNAWQLKLAAAGMQFGMTTLAIMRDPEMKAQAAAATRAQLAKAMAANGVQAETAAAA